MLKSGSASVLRQHGTFACFRSRLVRARVSCYDDDRLIRDRSNIATARHIHINVTRSLRPTPTLTPTHLPGIKFHLATMPESRSKHPLVWIDCEMTGLDTNKDTIMSLACFVTDYELNLLDDGYEAVIKHSQEQLDQMGEW